MRFFSIKNFLRHNFLWILMLILILNGLIAIEISIIKLYKTYNNSTITIQNFKSHQFQHHFEKIIEHELRLRNTLIGFNSQIFYSIFHKTFDGIIVGKNNELFQDWYITLYCHLDNWSPFNRKPLQQDYKHLVNWANKIQELNNFFQKHGKTFVYVITPSKAEYMPEAIPKRYHCHHRGIDPHTKEMVKLLKQRKIPYVNGAEMMVKATRHYGISMFPKGGTHWNLLGATLGANAIIDTINQEGHVHLNPIHFTYYMRTVKQRTSYDSDADLLHIIKLLHPNLNYHVPNVNYIDIKPNKPVTVTFIGGSFLDNIAKVFMENSTFSKIRYYFYLIGRKTIYEIGKKPVVTPKVNLSSPTLLKTILSSDVILLEENSSNTVSDHGETFYELMKKKHYLRLHS